MDDRTLFEMIYSVAEAGFFFCFIGAFGLFMFIDFVNTSYLGLEPALEPIVTSRLDILPHYVFNYLKASDIYVATFENGALVDLKRFILDPSLVHPETAKYWRAAITYRSPSTQEGIHTFELDYPNKKYIRFFARIPAKPDACPFELDPMNTPIPRELLPPEWQIEPLTKLVDPRPPLEFPRESVYISKPLWEYPRPPTGPDEVD